MTLWLPAPLPEIVPVVCDELAIEPSFFPTRPPAIAAEEVPVTLPEALPFVIEPPLMLSPTSPPTPPPPLTLAVADKPLIAVLFWPI